MSNARDCSPQNVHSSSLSVTYQNPIGGQGVRHNPSHDLSLINWECYIRDGKARENVTTDIGQRTRAALQSFCWKCRPGLGKWVGTWNSDTSVATDWVTLGRACSPSGTCQPQACEFQMHVGGSPMTQKSCASSIGFSTSVKKRDLTISQIQKWYVKRRITGGKIVGI